MELETPALVYGNPGFSLLYTTAGQVDYDRILAQGNWKYGVYRGAFHYKFSALDSLYRESFWKFDNGFAWNHFGILAGYGVSLEWIPGESLWTRHHCGLELLGRIQSLVASVSLDGFTDEKPQWKVAAFWNPSEHFFFYGEGTSDYGVIGYGVLFSHVGVETSFRFPGFATSLGAKLVWNGYSGGGKRLFGGEDLDWTSFWLHKEIKK